MASSVPRWLASSLPPKPSYAPSRGQVEPESAEVPWPEPLQFCPQLVHHTRARSDEILPRPGPSAPTDRTGLDSAAPRLRLTRRPGPVILMTVIRDSDRVGSVFENQSASAGAAARHEVLELQRMIGNRAVARLMRQSARESPADRDLRHAREHERVSETIPVSGGLSEHRPATVWASQSETSHIPREDARVRPAEVGGGEPGWDLGLQYTTLDDLIAQLRSHRVYVGTCQRLAINCHGAPGILRLEPFAPGERVHMIDGRRLQAVVEGRSSIPSDAEGTEDPEFRDNRGYYVTIVARLRTIAQFLTPSATVLFPGCIAGSQAPGTHLLRLLASPQVLGHRVVGFTRILSAEGQGAGMATGRSLPGARVTSSTDPTEIQGPRRIDDLGQRGRLGDWANEDSPAARVADPDGRVWSNSEAGAPAELEPGEMEPGDSSGWGAPQFDPPVRQLHTPPRRTLRHGQRVRDPVTGQWRRI